MVDIKKHLESQDKRNEELLKSIELVAKYVRKEIDETKQYGERLAKLESVSSSPGSVSSADIDSLRRELASQRQMIASRQNDQADLKKFQDLVMDEIELRVKEESEKIAYDRQAKLTEMENEIASVNDSLRSEIRRLRDEVISVARDSPKNLLEAEMERLDRSVQDSENRLKGEMIARIRNESSRMEEALGSKLLTQQGAHDYVSQMRSSREEFEKNKNELTALQDSLREDLKKADVNRFLEYIDVKTAESSNELSQTKASLEESMRRLNTDLNYRMNKMRKFLDEEEAEFRRMLSQEGLDALKRELAEVRAATDEESAKRISIERKLNDISASRDENEPLRMALDEESAKRISLEKQIEDMALAVTEMKKTISSAEKLLDMDLEKLQSDMSGFKEATKNAERDAGLRTVDIVAQQLHEFSKTLDRRMPDIVTREEFIKSVKEIKSKMGQSQLTPSQDLALALRVEHIEQEIDRIAGMVAALSNRVPVVLE